MSLLTTLTKKVAPSVISAGKSAGTGLLKGAGTLVKETGELGQALGNVVNKGYTSITGKAPSVPIGGNNGPFVAGSPRNTAINEALKASNPIEGGFKFAAQVPAYVSPKTILKAPGAITSGFKSAATNFAERMAAAESKVASQTSKNVPTKTYSDIKPPSSSSKIEAKTTEARTTPQIDTRVAPVKTGTTKKFPIGKTAIGLGGLGLGAAYLGSGGDQSQTTPESTFVPPNYGGANFVEETGTQTSNEFGPATTDFGDGMTSFASSAPAPQTGTGMGGSFQGTGLGGAMGGGISGAPSSPFNQSMIDEKDEDDERDELLKIILGQTEATDDEKSQRKQEEDLARRIAELTGYKELENLEIEGEPIAADARGGRRNIIDRETRRSMVPLQTSLALVQALRERSENDRKNQMDTLKWQYEQTKPEDQDNTGFTLGEGQQRYQINPKTGQYELVGSVAPKSTTTEDKILTPTEAAALGVPYGTTQSGAYGLNPSKLSGDAAKVAAITSTIVPEIQALKTRFQKDYKGALTGYLTGTDRELVKLVDQVADKVGRLRSGGAVNRDEEERFKRQIASFMDLPFGKSDQAIAALDGLINEAQQVSSSISPQMGGSAQVGGGGQWSW